MFKQFKLNNKLQKGHYQEMSTFKGPKKFSNSAQKSAYIGRVLIKLLYSSIENQIRPRSFKIFAMAVGQTFLKKTCKVCTKFK